MSIEWRDIAGYEGMYQVSNDGQVRSLKRPHVPKTIIMAAHPTSWGYLGLSLRRDGAERRHSVHRLVAQSFLGHPPFSDAVVRHLDGNPANNHVSNLAWGTAAENQQDSLKMGTHGQASKTHCKRGHPLSGDNLYIWTAPSGADHRICRACRRIQNQARKRRDKLRRTDPLLHDITKEFLIPASPDDALARAEYCREWGSFDNLHADLVAALKESRAENQRLREALKQVRNCGNES